MAQLALDPAYAQIPETAQFDSADGSDLEIVLYEGAEHSHDTPIPSRQGVAANVAASENTKRRVEAFVKLYQE